MTSITDYQVANEAEAAALEREWASGALDRLREPLLAFVERHREAIRQRAQGAGPDALLEATRELIRESRTVDLVVENRDQLIEIEKEVWYRGEEGNTDVQSIRADWARRYGADWRRWRILQYLYLAEKIAGEILRRLQDA